jgi:hypothetical protein
MPLRVAVVTLVLAVLAYAPAAHAGTVTVTTTQNCECDDEGGTDQQTHALVFTGAPGEANTVEASYLDGAYRLTDATAPLTAGTGCRQVSGSEASCAASTVCPTGPSIGCFNVFDVRVDGGDGDDTITIGSLPEPKEGVQDANVGVEGHDGNDTLNGGPLGDTLLGGAGRDTLNGGPGDDSLLPDAANLAQADTRSSRAITSQAVAPPDADTVDGGPGDDTVDYGDHIMPVTIDLVAGTAGELGEGDRLSGIENVIGGSGGNTLSGDDGPNTLTGGSGNDTIDGRGADDKLDGQAGPDELHGGAGDDDLRGDGLNFFGTAPSPSSDTLDGGPGSDTASWLGRPTGIRVDLSDPGPDGDAAAPDTLVSIENVTGTTSNDVLTGDGGPNVLQGDFGGDRITGGGGNDTLLSDGARDTLNAGPGDDFVAGAGRRTSCGPGADTAADTAYPLPRNCETIAFMPDFWSGSLGPPPAPLLLMANRPARTTRSAAFPKLGCAPNARCRGLFELITLFPGRRLARKRVALRGTLLRAVRIPLTKVGRRFVARRAGSVVRVRFRKRLEPLVLRHPH